MIIAEVFAGPDAAVIIAAIVGATVAIYKAFPKRENGNGVSLQTDVTNIRVALAEIRVKADQCWDYLFRRAASDVIGAGLGSANSPLQIKPEAMNWFAHMQSDLLEWYKKESADESQNERDLLINLDNAFGARILTEVSHAHKKPYPACLFIAFAVARDGQLLDLPCLSSPEKIDPPEVELT